MAGHSKWANIQHRKKAQDAKRGKIFTRLIREISVAAREGGGDADSNPRLRLAIEKANGANVPKDNIERAIKKATGELEGASFEEIRYEGYAPGGVAVMVDTLTDNRNRTVSEVRHAFSKHGGNLGTDGSVAFQFEKKGVITFAPGTSEEDVMEASLEAGAEDIVSSDDGSIEVLTAPEDFESVRDALRAAGLHFEDAEVTERAENLIALDVDSGRQVLKFLDVLEDLDDTQNVWSNADIPTEAYD
ncbi:YebC/PmpR family DNA-binding transcriptional regulator [Wenzhouxiangella sp. XN201]|uniref:YebC/PmpR family DNA-binding transcriptional regulator n=1 Tax=Wenzhouxiangella sp. XN201 TaxID=2710755 RepID=UPI0013CCF6FE|nr:YebC/PmpR family DNA-binding transcriptional regulator [Wenzhouxiangella sp. XN201]NEZ04600.1 YebC/PmpR family DNA-binding transcriptional regulator [Wenzhouxiangella sp. XN201]